MKKKPSANSRKVSAKPLYKDASRSPEARTRDLLQRMTLAEKAAQMQCLWCRQFDTFLNPDGDLDPPKARKTFKKIAPGQIGRPSDAGSTVGSGNTGKSPREMAVLANALQTFFRDETRLGIPPIFHEECLHGHAAIGGTSFPQPIALAGTFNPELIEALFNMTALETRLRGAHQALTPVVDIARDPRWGRVEETYGEDPYLVSRMGVAAVRGFQGRSPTIDKHHLIATLKHFVAHGHPESGQNCGPANVSMRVLREVFLPSFKAAVQEAGAGSVMASYNEVDGIPSHANAWLLRTILRDEWGFRGFVVSDYFAVWELSDRADTHGHHVAVDKKEACKLAVEAGVNIELPDPDCYTNLPALVKEGTLKEKQLDELIAPMLLAKFQLGLFDDPFVDPKEAQRVVGCQAHADLALRAAREAITLLKNDNHIAPLNPASLKTLAVIGPNADRGMLGGYSGLPPHAVSVLEGLREKLAGRVLVTHAQGCAITRPPTWDKAWYQDEIIPADPAEDARLIAQAVALANHADAIVLCLGGNEQTSREAWNRRHMGDRASLELIGRQNALVDALAALGKPIIACLFNGRPLAIAHLAQRVPVIFECWYLGQEGGHAVAEAIVGELNPSAKLPISFPRSAGHLPIYYNYKPSDRRGYLFDDVTPLFHFGFGLSYTTFTFAKPRLEKTRIRIPRGKLPSPETVLSRVHVRVTNNGPRAGTEIVQLYIRDCHSSVTRPVKELKGFQRVTLNPGESRDVALDITTSSLAFYDIKMRYTIEPGEFHILIGNSSRDQDLQKLSLHIA